MSAEELEKLFNLTTNNLNKCEEEFKEGKEVNMKDFEKSIESFCNLATNLPKEQAKKYEKELINISERLSLLAIKIKDKMASIQKEIKQLDKQMKATAAYKKPTENN